MNRAFGVKPPQQMAAMGLQPGGYLTLVSGTPAPLTDQASKTRVFYAFDKHAYVPLLVNGTMVAAQMSKEIYLDLTSAHAASGIYDVLAVNANGSIVLVTSPVWGTVTAGSGARGAGAGTPELTYTDGVLTNRWALPGLNGANSRAIGARCGTYLGSLFIDGSAGQVTCHRTWGQSRKWGVWNAYNRKRLFLKAGDSTASWTYTTSTFRASNADSANKVTVFMGLADEAITATFTQVLTRNATNATTTLAIGLNSTTAASGFAARAFANDVTNIAQTIQASYDGAPALGINNLQSLEFGTTASLGMNGTETNMMLLTRWAG